MSQGAHTSSWLLRALLGAARHQGPGRCPPQRRWWLGVGFGGCEASQGQDTASSGLGRWTGGPRSPAPCPAVPSCRASCPHAAACRMRAPGVEWGALCPPRPAAAHCWAFRQSSSGQGAAQRTEKSRPCARGPRSAPAGPIANALQPSLQNAQVRLQGPPPTARTPGATCGAACPPSAPLPHLVGWRGVIATGGPPASAPDGRHRQRRQAAACQLWPTSALGPTPVPE